VKLSGCFLIAVLFGLLASPSPANAADGSAFIGRWDGAVQQIIGPDDPALPPNPCKLEIVSVKNRRLVGTLTIQQPGEIIPCVFPMDITISAAGTLIGNGTEEDGDRVQIKGKVAAFGDGSVRLASFEYRIREADGSVRKGFGVFLQLLPAVQDGAPNIDGRWEGLWKSAIGPGGGCLEANLITPGQRNPSPYNEIFGGAMFEDFPVWPFMPVLNFGLIGTAGPPEKPGAPTNFILIGLTPSPTGGGNSVIAILIGLLLPAVQNDPARLQGDYLMFNSLQDLYLNMTTGKRSVLDKGAFDLPAVQ
jgi:hypothetical protein